MFGIIPFTNHNTNELGGNFRDFLSDFFNDDFFAPMTFTNGMDKFSTDVRETDNEYLVCAKLPGVNKEDIALDYENNNLIIKARSHNNYENNEEKYYERGASYSEFSKSYYFDNVVKDKIRAKFENGELKIILPKEVKTEMSNSSIYIE